MVGRCLLCIAAAVTVLFWAVPSIASAESGAQASGSLTDSACNLLGYAGALGLVSGGQPGSLQTVVDGCAAISCWETYTDPDTGSERCHYGRGATLALGHARSAKRADKLIRRSIGTGYRPVKVGADLAGIVVGPKGGGVVLAVGRSTALFALGATSDDNPDPTWGYDATGVLKGAARRIVRGLKRPGCPVDAGKCPSGH